MVMDQDIKRKWVEALRSGKYQQGREFLEHDGRYCCLGVLCKVLNQPTIDDGGVMEVLPLELALSLGFNDTGPGLVINNVAMAAAKHNDEGRTFAEIADAIEAQL